MFDGAKPQSVYRMFQKESAILWENIYLKLNGCRDKGQMNFKE
jgi:hypothetical protein